MKLITKLKITTLIILSIVLTSCSSPEPLDKQQQMIVNEYIAVENAKTNKIDVTLSNRLLNIIQSKTVELVDLSKWHEACSGGGHYWIYTESGQVAHLDYNNVGAGGMIPSVEYSSGDVAMNNMIDSCYGLPRYASNNNRLNMYPVTYYTGECTVKGTYDSYYDVIRDVTYSCEDGTSGTGWPFGHMNNHDSNGEKTDNTTYDENNNIIYLDSNGCVFISHYDELTNTHGSPVPLYSDVCGID